MLPIAVLAGGLATRLGSLTKDFPKCLIEINGKPFVDWQIELLKKNGYQELIFCLSYRSDLVQSYLGDGSRWDVDIQYSLDGEIQLGTGGAISKALPLLGDKFAVIYGDSFLPINYSEVEFEFLNSSYQALMTVFENKNELDRSNVQFDNGQLINYDKRSQNPLMRHIDYGLTYFEALAFNNHENGSIFDLADLCADLSIVGKLGGFEVSNRFYEVGSVGGINDLSNFLGGDQK